MRQISENPFALGDDFDVFQERARERKQKEEQARLVRETAIWDRTDSSADRVRLLGIHQDEGNFVGVRKSEQARAVQARQPPAPLRQLVAEASGPRPGARSRASQGSVRARAPLSPGASGAAGAAGSSSASAGPGGPAGLASPTGPAGRQGPSDASRLSFYAPVYSQKYAHLSQQDRDVLERLEREPGKKPLLSEFLARQREIFLVELSLQTKKNEIDSLTQTLDQKNRALAREAGRLEAEAGKFDKYVRQSDLGTVQSISASEDAIRLRVQRQEAIRSLASQMIALKGEIARHELRVLQLHRYRTFFGDLLDPSERDALISARELHTARRLAVALCVETYGTCEGLCLDCFCFPLRQSLAARGGARVDTAPQSRSSSPSRGPPPVRARFNPLAREDGESCDKILPPGKNPLLLPAEADGKARSLEERSYVTKYNRCEKNTVYTATFSVYSVPDGCCPGGCKNVISFSSALVPDQQDLAYLVSGRDSLVQSVSQSGSPGAYGGAVSSLLAANLSALGITMRVTCPVAELPLSEFSHFPTSEPGLPEYSAACVGCFVLETPELPFVNTGDLLDNLRALEAQNFFLLEHLQDAETSLDSFKARSAAESAGRLAELSSLRQQLDRLRDYASRRGNQEAIEDAARTDDLSSDTQKHIQRIEAAVRKAYQSASVAAAEAGVKGANAAAAIADAASLSPSTLLGRLEGMLDQYSAVTKQLPEDFQYRFERQREHDRKKAASERASAALREERQAKMAKAQERALEPIKDNRFPTTMVRVFPGQKKRPAGSSPQVAQGQGGPAARTASRLRTTTAPGQPPKDEELDAVARFYE